MKEQPAKAVVDSGKQSEKTKAENISWPKAYEIVKPHVVRISTPSGSGTGFMVSRAKASDMCGIATAAHVIDHAHYWEQPIRIDHVESGKSILLHNDERVIFPDEKKDTAAILFNGKALPLPEQPLPLAVEGYYLKIGNEIAWMGFPAISHQNLCFFSGRISCFVEKEFAYLVDGVAINGVSGGPALFNGLGNIRLVGVVSAYMPNRATGETLPGLAVVRDVVQMQDLVKTFKSMDEAKEKAPPPTEPPSPPSGAKSE